VSSQTNADSETDTDPTAHWSFETKQIHAGQRPDPTTNARALPIYQTTSYVFDDTSHAAALFGLEIPGNIYTRIGNPTTDVVEQRIAALEGGVAALFLASGQAAETFAILNLAGAGDHIVSSPRLYGGTYNLFHYSLPKLGVDVSFVEDPDDLDSWRAAVRPNTKAFFAEIISNPQIDVLDTPGVSAVAHEHGVPLIVDNTVATPYLIQPIAQGADIVVHSATKYLGGHGAAIAGVIVDGGTFNWTPDRFPGFTTPDPSYHGVVYAELGPPAFALKARVQLLRDYGSAASPFNAFLPSSPWYERAKKLAPKGTGAVLAFELAGGVEAGKAFVNALKLHSHVANIGDVRSLVIHPASTTHSQLSPAEQLSTGVSPGLVRLAVGIEGIDDILADLELGFAAARKYGGATAGSGDPHAVAAF
jgi:O-acetylhomoserine (thiol)-lyase